MIIKQLNLVNKPFGYKNWTSIEGISASDLNIDKTFNCGQCFRWQKLGERSVWGGVIGNEYIIISQFINNSVNRNELAINTVNKSTVDKVLNYLDIYTDYTSKLIIPETDIFANESYKEGQGIRILNQDAWEATISFIISQRNNIPKIQSTIEKLCILFGEPIQDQSGKTFYTFPTAKILMNADRNKLLQSGVGYRDVYIIEAARTIYNKNIDLDKLKHTDISGSQVVDILTTMYGIGPKVANCIALFGLHKLDTWPIDIWMQRVSDELYNGNLNPNDYGEYCGIMQQYMFYNMRKF